jgi:CBS domain-containing protein
MSSWAGEMCSIPMLLRNSGRVSIGHDNRFLPSTFIRTRSDSKIVIGSDCGFGPGGATVAAVDDQWVRIGDAVRVNGSTVITGASVLGNGSQVLGLITIRAIELAGGANDTFFSPDLRDAVLKKNGQSPPSSRWHR